jgi:hypothetical protein
VNRSEYCTNPTHPRVAGGSLMLTKDECELLAFQWGWVWELDAVRADHRGKTRVVAVPVDMRMLIEELKWEPTQ